MGLTSFATVLRQRAMETRAVGLRSHWRVVFVADTARCAGQLLLYVGFEPFHCLLILRYPCEIQNPRGDDLHAPASIQGASRPSLDSRFGGGGTSGRRRPYDPRRISGEGFHICMHKTMNPGVPFGADGRSWRCTESGRGMGL
jgi:hypothetical protein